MHFKKNLLKFYRKIASYNNILDYFTTTFSMKEKKQCTINNRNFTETFMHIKNAL